MHHFEYWAPLVQTFWPLIDPFVAVLDGARLQRGEVRAGLGLGEALAPDLLGAEDRARGSAPSARRCPRPSASGRRAAARARSPAAARARGRSPRSRSPTRSAIAPRPAVLGRPRRAPPSRRRRAGAASRAARRSGRPRRRRWARPRGGCRRASRAARRGRRSPGGLKVRSIGVQQPTQVRHPARRDQAGRGPGLT